MSNHRGGGGSRGGGGGSGVGKDKEAKAIPESVTKTIQSIREITGKQHSDEDILTVLEDCSMDADETAQRLLYLDTFHEVKRKPRKKETLSKQGRGSRGNQATYHDAFGGSAAPRRGNGINHVVNNNLTFPIARASNVTTNGPSSLPNESSSLEHNRQLPASGVTKDGSATDAKKTSTSKFLPAATSPGRLYSSVIQAEQGKFTSSSNHPSSTPPVSLTGVHCSASDPVLTESVTEHPVPVGAIGCDIETQQEANELKLIQGDICVSDDVGSKLPKNDEAGSRTLIPAKEEKAVGKSKDTEKHYSTHSLEPSTLPKQNGFLSSRSLSYDTNLVEEIVIPPKGNADGKPFSPATSETTITNGHVIFPNNFKVPEALKSGLIFGNFDNKSGQETKFSNDDGCDTKSEHATELSRGADEAAREPSNHNVSSTMQVDHSDQPSSADHGLNSIVQADSNIVPMVDSKGDQSKQESRLLSEGLQDPIVQVTPSYNDHIIPHMGQPLQFEGNDIQAQDTYRVSSFVTESPTSSSTSSTPPAQINMTASPQPVFIRPPYHLSYLPYGPYYFLPLMHQYLSQNGLSQQPLTADAYLASPTAAGMKFSLPHLKSGVGAGNPAPAGLPPLYGPYGSSPVSFNPGPALTSGSSASNGDILASQLKESHIYTTAPMTEVSAWIPPPGQDISSLQFDSLYHLPPQGQHLAFSPAQAGHAHFGGLYPPGQTMAAPSTLNQLSQQSQVVSAVVESGGRPSGAYQQPQLTQIDWSSSY